MCMFIFVEMNQSFLTAKETFFDKEYKGKDGCNQLIISYDSSPCLVFAVIRYERFKSLLYHVFLLFLLLLD